MKGRITMERLLVVLGLLLVVLEGSLAGHHSVSARFDTTQLVSFSGVITKVELTNPHVRVHLNVKDAEGKVYAWIMEMAPPNPLRRTVDLKIFQVGLQVTVESWIAKNGDREASARVVITPDGQRLSVGDSWFEVEMSVPRAGVR
jgi:hypothetical protein